MRGTVGSQLELFGHLFGNERDLPADCELDVVYFWANFRPEEAILLWFTILGNHLLTGLIDLI